MSINSIIVDGAGTDNRVSVDHKALCTTATWPVLPAEGSESRFQFFSQLASSVGDGTGTTNCNVDGSSTPQTFTVNSHKDYDIRVMKIVIFIEDGSVTHSGFGALAALTNGIDISLIEGKEETFLVNGAKKFASLIEQTLAERPFGDGAKAFELESTTSNQDSQILPFDVGSLVPGGVRIAIGTLDRLQLEVNDDLTGLTNFTVRCLGYKHIA